MSRSGSTSSIHLAAKVLASGGDYVGVRSRQEGEDGSNEVEGLAGHVRCLQVSDSLFLIGEITSIPIRLWHLDNVKVPRAIYHGTYLVNVMFITHVRLMGYDT